MWQHYVSSILSLLVAGTALLLLAPPVAAGGSLLPGALSGSVPEVRVASEVVVAVAVLRARVPLVLQGNLRVVLLVVASMLLLRVAETFYNL